MCEPTRLSKRLIQDGLINHRGNSSTGFVHVPYPHPYPEEDVRHPADVYGLTLTSYNG